jgi:hypothetical protein
MQMKLLRNKLLIPFVLLILLYSCNSGEEYTIEYNLKAGDVFNLKSSAKTEIQQSFQGQIFTSTSLMEASLTYSVAEVYDDAYVLNLKINSMESTSENNLEVEKMVMSSETEDTLVSSENFGAIYKAITGNSYAMHIDKHGKLLSFSGVDEAIGSIGKYFDNSPFDEEMKAMLINELSGQLEDDFSSFIFEQFENYYPVKQVKIGEKWTVESNITANQVRINLSVTNTLKSVDNNIAVIESEGVIATPEEGAVVEILGMEVVMKMDGTLSNVMKIDLSSGIVVEQETKQNMIGETSLNGTTIPQEFKINTKMWRE